MVIMEHQKAILRLRPTQAVCGIQMTFRIWVVILTTTFFSNHLFGQSISIEDADFEKYLEKKAIPIVKGKILNLTPAELSDLKINYTLVTPFANFQETRSIALNGDGSFELKLDHAFPFQQIWLAVGEIFYAGIYANTDLFVEFDALTLKSQTDAAFYCPGVKYLGTDGDLNRYINNRTLYQRETQVKVNSAATMMAYQHLPYPQFLKKYDSLFSILRQIDQNFIKSQPLEYSWMIVNDRDSEYYSNLYVYHFGRPMPAELFEKINKHKPQLISNDGMLFYQYSVLYLQMLPRKNKSSNLKERTLTTIRKIDSLYSPPKSDMLKLKWQAKIQ